MNKESICIMGLALIRFRFQNNSRDCCKSALKWLEAQMQA